jgi:hypothetical protein
MDNLMPTTQESMRVDTRAEDKVILEQIIEDKNAAIEYQKPRQGAWTENYNLARDRVVNNPLIQRHPVNVPLMKENELAWLGKIDDVPEIYFDCISEDMELAQKNELLINEYWQKDYDRLNMAGIDFIGKRIVFYTGRTHSKIGIKDGKFMVWPLDPFDVVVDPKTDPLDLQSAMHIHNMHIYKTLREVLADNTISKEAKSKLNSYIATNKGMFSTSDTADQIKAKMERLSALNINNYDSIIGTDILIECTETVRRLWNKQAQKFDLYVILQAFDTVILKKRTMREALGVDWINYATWCYNPDTQLYWELGPGDITRNPNKISNLWLSQLLENRTLRNYQMHFYDATNEEFSPDAFIPRPFGFYGLPGNPNDIIKSVPVLEMSESLDELEYVRTMGSRGMITTDIDKGMTPSGNRTKGEIEILANRSQRQVNNLQKFYSRYWYDIANMWKELSISKAISSDRVKLEKRGNNSQMYQFELKPKSLNDKSQYRVKVTQKSQKEDETKDKLQKIAFARQQFANDPIAMNIISEKLITELELFTPEEIKNIKNSMRGMQSQPVNQTIRTLGVAQAMAGAQQNA